MAFNLRIFLMNWYGSNLAAKTFKGVKEPVLSDARRVASLPKIIKKGEKIPPFSSTH
jgi:hypothetical protein